MDAERLEAYRNRFIDAMDDDFNTPEALALLFELVKGINKAPDKSAQLVDLLKDLAGLLGLLQQSPEAFLQGTAAPGISAEEVEALIAARNAARAAKEWAKADQLRDELIANGILLDDGREGTSWRRQST